MSSSGQNILEADLLGFDGSTNTPERKVIVLWDYENCPVPKGVSGLSAIRNIREAALEFGSIDQFEAYCDWSNKASVNIRNDLSISGVKLRDCPKKGWIGTVDKAIVVDMMVYALERPRTTTILLILGDRDHAYAISTLRNRGYPVKLLAPSGTLHSGLQTLADLLNWNSIFKSDLPPTELVDFSGLAGDEEAETEEEDEDTSEENEVEGEDEEMETEETAQVQVGVESEVEEIVKLQVETEKKVQVLVETDDEGDYGEPALPGTQLQSESVATLAPAEIPPMWAPAEPALLSKVVHLELLSARAQEQQEERLRSSPLPSPSPSTWSQTVPSSYVGGSSQLEFGASFTQQPQTVPPSYVGWSSQPRFWGSVVQQPQSVPPSYHGGGSSQHGFEASVVQHPARDVPPKFFALVQELEAIKASGSPAPGWSSLISRVKQRQPSVLHEAGVEKWPEYLYLAEKEGVVELQRRHPDRIGGMKVILRMSPNYDGGSTQPGFGASSKQKRQTVLPSYGGGSNQPMFGASSIHQPQTASVSYSVGSSQPKFGASVVQHGARDVPLKFLVLVQELEAIKARGSPAPRWNDLGKLVKQRVPSVVSDAGVQSWRRYLLLAEQEGIIEIMRQPNKGRNIGKSTISLRI